MSSERIARVLAIVSLAWGTVAFGATYEWASRSLAVMASLAAAFCYVAGRFSPGPGKLLIIAMGGVLVAIGVQLIPLSQDTINHLNPARHQLLSQLDMVYMHNPGSGHALSIDPPLTRWALLFCAVVFIWMLGLVKLLQVTGSRWLLNALSLLGFVIALIGIIQNALYHGRVYGLWAPESPNASPFGPFINKNHFAGWMLMVLPMTFGFVGLEMRRSRISGLSWRERFLWLSSKSANRMSLLIVATAVMALALILTFSRSGITALSLALILLASFALRSSGSRVIRSLVAFTPLLVAILMLMWVGPEAIVERFQGIASGDLALRQAAWADARDIAMRFPVAGTGLNTYGTATLFLQTRLMQFHFVQAHSDFIQLWAEGGLLLTLPTLIFGMALTARIAKVFRSVTNADSIRVGAVVGMLAILFQEAVDFSLQMPGNLLLFATLCAIALHVPPVKQRLPRSAGPR